MGTEDRMAKALEDIAKSLKALTGREDQSIADQPRRLVEDRPLPAVLSAPTYGPGGDAPALRPAEDAPDSGQPEWSQADIG